MSCIMNPKRFQSLASFDDLTLYSGYPYTNKNIQVKCPRWGRQTTLRDAHAIAAVIASRDV